MSEWVSKWPITTPVNIYAPLGPTRILLHDPARTRASSHALTRYTTSGSACSTGSSSVSESPVRMNRGRVPSYLREGRGRVEQISRGVISIEHAWKNNRRDTHSIRSYYEGMKEQQEAAGSRSRGLSNMSNVVLGDDRIHWDKSFSQEAFKLDAVRARSVKRHANFSEKVRRFVAAAALVMVEVVVVVGSALHIASCANVPLPPPRPPPPPPPPPPPTAPRPPQLTHPRNAVQDGAPTVLGLQGCK